jgi:hypothetical protein
MLEDTSLASSLAAVGASTDQSLSAIANSADTQRLENNPRRLDPASILSILRTIN